MKVTLVDSKNAREGYEFILLNYPEECSGCSLMGVCLGNLERGRRYRIVSVRDKEHDCAIFGKVRVVETEECSVRACMEENKVYPGSTVTYEPRRCGEIFCDNYKYCIPEGLRKGDSCRIEDDLGKLQCQKGFKLRLVELKRTA